MYEKKNIEWINYAKGGGIVLVVLGHTISGMQGEGIVAGNVLWNCMYSIINTFHMTLFFILSGYLHKFDYESELQREYWIYARKKIVNLGVPYLMFNIIYACCGFFINNGKYTLHNLLFIWAKPISHFWFVYVLLIILLCFPLLKKLFKGRDLLLLLTTFLIYVLLTPFVGGVWEQIISYLPIFCVGHILKIQKVKILGMVQMAVWGSSFIMGLFISEMYKNCILIEVICALSGSLFFINLMNCLCKIGKKVGTIFSYFGKETMPIYLCHSLFVSASRKVFLICNIRNDILLVFFGVLVGVIGPLVLREVARYVTWVEYILYPEKVIDKQKRIL